ncbi:glycosyl hydrolase family 18 protein [Enterovibrio sp. ZSDZ42]|uniref:Glycosyl hydrolase family 18 protein n=1 Tax=Enterovibrio gelatinilyticus TaxID=2899819 RepID=A0ABT5R3H4_9GAMM|nr:immunoglobulin-like domain-containing protein [Enterovibrio sp. ZSDZ42]MDD1794067.1 glycosyl hydrolase family 18 protein [Enterovibrio sp. ZSDZ42]
MTFKPNAICAALFLGLASFSSHASVSAVSGDDMVNPKGGVVVGYWHNWCDGAGYKRGNAPCVTLEEVNPMYNVVDVSFMKVFDTAEGRIPTFRLDPMIGLSEQDFINEIAELNRQGRSVLLALGGADAHVELKTGDEQAFADEIIRLTDLYGFDGLDIDLEQAAVTAADNQTVIPAALRMVKDHYAAQGKNFLITMAPEFPYLTDSGKYVPYITALEGYYDWINPQFYNQGGDGIWIDGVGWIAQNNDELKQEFIYYISDSLINGTRGFHKIPHDKLVFGIPSSDDAAATGFVKDPAKLYAAFGQLSNQGQPLRGVMTWSVNWDMGTDAAGNQYNEQFIKDYGPFIHGQTPPPPAEGKPVFSGVIDVRVRHGDEFDAMAGVSAMDEENGDLTFSIVVDGSVDTSRLGQYVLVYSVSDEDDNETKATRTVEVYSQKPVFSGVEKLTLKLGTEFDAMAGVKATDAEDGDLTSTVSVESNVDTSLVGKYNISYSVTDSALQTVTVDRMISVTDGSTCVNAWDASEVYNTDDIVSHAGKTWQAGWWTRGEEPGTTGEWGVWRETGDSDCGDTGTPTATLKLSGVKNTYTANNGSMTLDLSLESNQAMTAEIKVTGASVVSGGETQVSVDGKLAVSLTLSNVEVGQYAVSVVGKTESGTTVQQNAAFTVKDEAITPPPGGEYPNYVSGTAYAAGDMVTGVDGNIYECKPWPYTSWCANASYAPGDSLYWADAWDKR